MSVNIKTENGLQRFDSGTSVIANPTLSGTEDSLESLQVGGTIYKGISDEEKASWNGKADKTLISDAWDNTKTYDVGEYCISGNTLYKCKLQCINVQPPNVTYWESTQIADELSELNTSKQITDFFDSTTQYLDACTAFIIGKTIQIQISSTATTGNFQLGIVKQKYRPVVATYLVAYLFSGSAQAIVSITTNGVISVNNISGTSISTQGYGTYIIA